ncbi:DUF4097 family beta strand repeat-containing protein [Limosilactobacillus fastidiosus]|uniref:DUF4097 family beta strand repeat protein n=1 Tax=Limosilactobacillus fastidiosus TaxID=2759855 RepID=A0A7W3TYJ0_9LACO|nr:DUF4097 family beta strand repeat-containing protein [Limosilactobacillus fastidiosus]MBB1085567.1 DUF4097 family beta strand repeat protein [Limosilactobacillus fastidiosus]MCD7086020.1 DUF4097 domain-containing protein [Limosilactobacillus fastidiosus]MCD7114336.1 DUF4097 domain-containing protein [Limosilactobacillus fastidiosus]MCD7116343.1 DUF4097 domain-containing protein [Limosilactobacillus fastidiosus]
MKQAIKLGSILFVCGLIISGIAYLGHKQPFDPMTPIEESQANKEIITRKQFSKINATASSADVVIKQGQHYTVSYYGKKTHPVHARVKDGVLKITQMPVTYSKFNNFHIGNNSDNERFIITVPKGLTLSKIKGHVNNDLVINRVPVKEVTLNSNSGDINILNSAFNGGKIATASGNISIRRSSLFNTKLITQSGDIDLSQTSLIKGISTLSSGNFSGHRLTITGHYTVTNQSGDNTIIKSKIDGAKLTTTSGSNKLKRRVSDGGSLKQMLDSPNVIFLKSISGNNTIK